MGLTAVFSSQKFFSFFFDVFFAIFCVFEEIAGEASTEWVWNLVNRDAHVKTPNSVRFWDLRGRLRFFLSRKAFYMIFFPVKGEMLHFSKKATHVLFLLFLWTICGRFVAKCPQITKYQYTLVHCVFFVWCIAGTQYCQQLILLTL